MKLTVALDARSLFPISWAAQAGEPDALPVSERMRLDAISLLAVSLLFVWDCYVIAASACDVLFTSHDEYGWFGSRDELIGRVGRPPPRGVGSGHPEVLPRASWARIYRAHPAQQGTAADTKQLAATRAWWHSGAAARAQRSRSAVSGAAHRRSVRPHRRAPSSAINRAIKSRTRAHVLRSRSHAHVRVPAACHRNRDDRRSFRARCCSHRQVVRLLVGGHPPVHGRRHGKSFSRSTPRM